MGECVELDQKWRRNNGDTPIPQHRIYILRCHFWIWNVLQHLLADHNVPLAREGDRADVISRVFGGLIGSPIPLGPSAAVSADLDTGQCRSIECGNEGIARPVHNYSAPVNPLATISAN